MTLASFFAYQSGMDVLPAAIQCLNERKRFENEFLRAVARSSIPATLAWGIHDNTIHPAKAGNTIAGRC
jgi:hypothetical protein